MRILLYCQHLSGVGHFVRTFEIARGFAREHEVFLVDGGRPVPRDFTAARINAVTLPRIARREGQLVGLDDPEAPLAAILQMRAQQLANFVAEQRPDVIVVEHFPFSKWEVADEILALLGASRSASADALRVCSLRDISPASRYDPSGSAYRARTLAALESHFDLLLVHADPQIVWLDASLSWVSQIPIPIHYTGYVSERLVPSARSGRIGDVLVSGGGLGGRLLFESAIGAWRLLGNDPLRVGRRLVCCRSLEGDGKHAGLALGSDDPSIQWQPFHGGFLEQLAQADLSISHAGYNTCANLLETRTRAILTPHPTMADQALRAARFAELGIAQCLPADALTPERLATAIRHALASPCPTHSVALDGAVVSRERIEEEVKRLRVIREP